MNNSIGSLGSAPESMALNHPFNRKPPHGFFRGDAVILENLLPNVSGKHGA
jgi:hypothetical protein